MAQVTKIWTINCSLLFIAFFECGGPREVYDWVGGGVRNPQYLFADSEFPVCRRIRRIMENDKPNIFIENTSQHSMLISYSYDQLRNYIVLCHKYKVLGWKLKD